MQAAVLAAVIASGSSFCVSADPTAVVVPPAILAAIKVKAAAEDHDGDYATQLYAGRIQIDAFKKHAAFKPEGMPDKVVKQILADAAKNHPDDYSTQMCVATEQIDASRELNRLDGVGEVTVFVVLVVASAPAEATGDRGRRPVRG